MASNFQLHLSIVTLVLRELADAYKASDHGLVVDLSENNFTAEHLQYFAKWLSDNDMHLYAVDLSLNRIFSATWADVLPSIDLLLKHVELLHLGGNYLPALQNIPELQSLQDRNVAFLAQTHSFSSSVCPDPWVEGWKSNAKLFSQEAYREDVDKLDADGE